MLIVCPSCAMTYNLSAESLGANGRSVRCVRCKNIWHAEAPREAKLLAAVGASSPGPAPLPGPALEAENVTLYAGDEPAEPAGNGEWTLQPGDGQPSYEDAPEAAV